ncbi:MAG: UbiA prenyltransferase [Candidatus Syntrophoarchaeum caldarius]|uniref:UbiA prenyltransferase n=1 Tax=Candidatus Syntropharchaeum caldarium TaxID=1838285 RepID=A0A1F2P870_9EURY|nr:MAG: UbiA prenyltransferase [Candidatus Syntrophoarchaeum caldarius]
MVGHYQNFRVIDWRTYIAMALFGYIIAGGVAVIFDLPTLFLVLTTSLYLAFAFSVNNCFDLKEDIKSGKKNNPIAVGLIGFREALIISLSTAVLGGVISYIYFGGIASVIFILLLILAFAYSAPPLRLKAHPPFDTISHGLFFGSLLFLYGYAILAAPSSVVLLIALSIFVYSITIELKNHINDYESDLAAGTITTACWLGIERTKQLFLVLHGLHFLILFAILYIYSRTYLPYIVIAMLLIWIMAPEIEKKIPASDVAAVFPYLGILLSYIH